jgi:hypothetical protein
VCHDDRAGDTRLRGDEFLEFLGLIVQRHLKLLEAVPPELVVSAPRRLVGSSTGGRHSVTHINGRGVRCGSHHRLVGGVDDVESAGRARFAELAVDEESTLVFGPRHW